MAHEKFNPALNGNRKAKAESLAVRYGYPWPISSVKQWEVFSDWKYMAAQIIHHEGASFRLLSIIDQVIGWDSGEVWASDQEMSVEAGGCGIKTISREVAMLKSLGLIEVDLGWRDKMGKLIRSRKIRLALPKTMPDYVHVRFS